MVCSLVSICFNSPQLSIQEKENVFCVWFFKKNVSHATLYCLTKFHCLIAFTSRNTGQYVYYDCLLTSILNLKLTLSFLSRGFATWPKSQDKNLNIFRTKRALEVKEKVFFIIFKGLSVAKNCLRPEGAPLNIQCLN